MVLNTITVGAAVTPTIISTGVTHYLKRKPLRQKPTAHIEYHEGIALIRAFLHHSSFHTVDEVQAFTAQWVPVPAWVKTKEVNIPQDKLTTAANFLREQLGPEGVKAVGGETWWTWRGSKGPLQAEWIEMRKDYYERKKQGVKGDRIMMYIHGGAYYFGSVDEHRYQMQRHARKLKARILAPRYRLAPQFPFPCGLYDCLATYLWLLEQHDPSTIILAGDSAGGGMTLSLLCILRDRGIPMPAGAVLLSPWVDLTHSFPSLGGDGAFDYIPAHGFIHKPSMSWPPPNKDDMIKVHKEKIRPEQIIRQPSVVDKVMDKEAEPPVLKTQSMQEAVQGFQVVSNPENEDTKDAPPTTRETDSEIPDRPELPTKGLMESKDLEITIDGKLVRIRDQIQIYAPNHLLSHPLVSPVLQPTLGGLPPLLIQVGGGELLRDEQIYLAHKAANPGLYKPSEAFLDCFDPNRELCNKWDCEPTNVQLQVWDDLCHVAHTLSFTRPAKFMYRSVAQFSAWALARAQQQAIDIVDDDDISVVSTESDSQDTPKKQSKKKANGTSKKLHTSESQNPIQKSHAVGKAGDPLPPFEDHMIRQRVDRHGIIYPLTPAEEMEAVNLASEQIGAIKEGPVRKWMDAQQKWNKKFAREKRAVQKKRMAEMAKGYDGFDGENPPPTALAGRRKLGEKDAQRLEKQIQKKSWGMSLWSLWGSKHDETTIDREKRAEAEPAKTKPTSSPRALDSDVPERPGLSTREHSHVTHRSVTDEGQAPDERKTEVADENVVPQDNTTLYPIIPIMRPPISIEPPPKSPKRMSIVHTSSPPTPTESSSMTGFSTPISAVRPPTPTKSPRRSLSQDNNPPSNANQVGASQGQMDSLDEIVRADHSSNAPSSTRHSSAGPSTPNPTVIPPSDTLSTRPTRDGIAYPFKLQTGDEGKDVNASTVTLNGTPLDGSDSGSNDGQPLTPNDHVVDALGIGKGTDMNGTMVAADGPALRPHVERFETAREQL